MNRIRSEVEAKIIQMWFEGVSRDETARVLMVGEGTVTEKLKSLPSCVEPLRDLSKLLRKHNFSLGDALNGARFLQLLKERGGTPERLSISLEAIEKTSTEAGYEPRRVIQATEELVEFERQSGKKYPEALNEFKALTEKNPELENENFRLKKELEENKQLRDKTIEQANTTPKKLSEYFDCKAAFHRYGMRISDAKTVRKVLDNFKEAGGNAKHFVSLVKRYGSIAKLVVYFERRLPTVQDEHANLVKEIKEYREIVTQLQGEQRQLESVIDSQKNAINYYSYQLNLILANIAKLEERKEALIAWIGKQLEMPQEEVEILRLHSESDIILTAIDNELRNAQARVMRSLR